MTDLQSWKAGNNNRLRALMLRASFVTAHEVLALSSQQLQARLRQQLSPADVEKIYKSLAQWRLPVSTTVAEALNLEAGNDEGEGEEWSEALLKTGVSDLDGILNGGLRLQSVTEIVGEASSGKSHLALQLSVQVQLPVSEGGLHGSVAYISSEGRFPSHRMLQMLRLHNRNASGNKNTTSLANIHLAQSATFEELDHCIRYTLSPLADSLITADFPLRLVVIDSLAASVRSEYDASSESLMQRGKDLALFGQLIKTLAVKYNLLFVVINQVSDVPNRPMRAPSVLGTSNEDPSASLSTELSVPYDSQAPFFAATKGQPNRHAALGLVWANCVDTRLFLRKSDRRYLDRSEDLPDAENMIRTATVIWSAFGPPKTTEYIINESGIQGIGSGSKDARRFVPRLATEEEKIAEMPAQPNTSMLVDDEEYWSQVENVDVSGLKDEFP